VKWTWLFAVAAAACGPARPEKLHTPKLVPHPDGDRTTGRPPPVLTPLPDIDVSVFMPDFHDELRWPLTPMNHPVMEPKFPIAPVFAQPGVGWLELCDRGVQNRYGGDKEMLMYLRGWCRAIEGDVDAACSNLAPLIHTTTPRLEAAVRNDLANILAQGHAGKAEHFIRVYALRDVGMLDLLAANFVEVGTADDALAINRDAIASDDYASTATKCIRWTKHIVLAKDTMSPLLTEIEAFAKAPKNPDPTCVREYEKLRCWAQRDCAVFAKNQGGVLYDGEIVATLLHWNEVYRYEGWWKFAGTVNLELNTPHAGSLFSDAQLVEIEVAALENAIRTEAALVDASDCARVNSKALQQFTNTLAPFVDKALADRLALLRQRCPW
jgi:hypothetical protein